MKERPILFSGSMVRALLAGTKTQTRRVAKPVRHPDLGNVYAPGALVLEHEPQHVIDRCCPYGRPGDRLWVRESHWWFKDECDHETGYYPPALTADDVEYRADGESKRHGWRPSIHMPRWASRILLDIKAVRVERLQDINEMDAAAEGVATWAPGALSPDSLNADPSDQFRWLWTSINGPDSWAQNPWVWVVEFKRVQQASSGRPSQLEDAPCSA